jgi:putative colanic acid biosynthesis glycosyltransferase
MPFVSIITIVRNDSLGLGRTRVSIAEQTFHDLEWLIVDGASDDGTAEVALGFDEPYVFAVSEPDSGIYDAMNKGLARASGEYVLFLNARDTFAGARVLESVAARLRQSEADFLYGDSLEAFGGGRTVYKTAQGHARVNYGMFACHQAMYFRRAMIGSQRYDTTLRIAGDYAFAAEFLKKSPRIDRLPEALCVFDLSGTSVVNRQRGREENWRVQRDVLGLSLPRRCITRAAYLGSAFLATRVPGLYKVLRFRT